MLVLAGKQRDCDCDCSLCVPVATDWFVFRNEFCLVSTLRFRAFCHVRYLVYNPHLTEGGQRKIFPLGRLYVTCTP